MSESDSEGRAAFIAEHFAGLPDYVVKAYSPMIGDDPANWNADVGRAKLQYRIDHHMATPAELINASLANERAAAAGKPATFTGAPPRGAPPSPSPVESIRQGLGRDAGSAGRAAMA